MLEHGIQTAPVCGDHQHTVSQGRLIPAEQKATHRCLEALWVDAMVTREVKDGKRNLYMVLRKTNEILRGY